jgi:hypothetical protein
MIRRTSWRHYHRDHLEIAARTARWMAALLNWDEAKLQREIARYQELTGMNCAVPAHTEGTGGRAATSVPSGESQGS